MEKYFVVGLFIIIGGVIAVISLMSRKKSEHQENQQPTQQTNEQPQTSQLPKRFYMGKYPGGVPNVSVAC